MTRRIDRVNGLLREEISTLLSREMKDPRLTGLFSLTHVQTSVDLRQARVFVSVMGDFEDKQRVLAGLNSAAGFIRRQLGSKLALKHIPEMSFVLDESMEKATELLRLMDRVASDDDKVTS